MKDNSSLSDRASPQSELLLALAARCEREEPSWTLTCEIEAAITPGAEIQDCSKQGGPIFLRIWGKREWRPARYTTSLDAAVMLVPEGCWWEGNFSEHATSADVHHPEIYDEIGRGRGASTPALALCAAALRARAALAEQTQAPDTRSKGTSNSPPPKSRMKTKQ